MFDDGFDLIRSNAVDAVVIASHDSTHAGFALAGIEAGKPMLCEKPLSPTAAEVRTIADAEARTGKPLLALSFMRRFDPSYVKPKQVADSGELGDILVAHCVSRTVETYPGGDSASTVTNAAIHELDIVPWLLNSPIVEVSWHCGRTSRNSGTRQDPQIMLLRMESDVLVTVEVVGELGAAALVADAVIASMNSGGTPVRVAEIGLR